MSYHHNFKIGDKVSYNGESGVIIMLDKTLPSGLLGAMVEWDNDKLLPPQMTVPYSHLTLISRPPSNQSFGNSNPLPSGNFSLNKAKFKNTIETHCPVCDTEWKMTYVFKEPAYDCLKCNKTKEDIVANYKEEPVGFNDMEDSDFFKIFFEGAD